MEFCKLKCILYVASVIIIHTVKFIHLQVCEHFKSITHSHSWNSSIRPKYLASKVKFSFKLLLYTKLKKSFCVTVYIVIPFFLIINVLPCHPRFTHPDSIPTTKWVKFGRGGGVRICYCSIVPCFPLILLIIFSNLWIEPGTFLMSYKLCTYSVHYFP